MGMFLKPSKSGKSVNVYVGPRIKDGRPFPGSKMRTASGAKDYSHLNFERKGDAYASRPKGGSVFRAAGQKGRRSR